jgi:GT2 family glycosyltransferase
MKNLSVAVVVLHYNRLKDTVACMSSLLVTDPMPAYIYLIDNASSTVAREELKKRYGLNPDVDLYHLEKNTGYAGGMNYGIRLALKNEQIDTIVLLNNDTTVQPDSLIQLATCLSDQNNFHIATPKILYEDNKTIWSTGERVFYPLLWANREKGKIDASNLHRFKNINCVTGCAMAIKREVFEKIGLLDEAYFAYVEDVDFCKRAVDAGFHLICCAGSRILHKESRSLGDFSPGKQHLLTRNKAYFIQKNIPPIWWPVSFTWYLGVNFFWILRALLSGKAKVAGSILRGINDFAKKKMGPPFR